MTLTCVNHHSSPATRGRTRQRNEHPSTHVEPVEVSEAVMDYIEQKCPEKLQKIHRNSFSIERQPDLRAVHRKPNGKVWVTFRPFHPTDKIHCDLVRQRFITFYQRTASDLQTTRVSLNTCEHLKGKFPHLLFKQSHNRCEVTGPFAHIAKLKELLPLNTPSSSRTPVSKVPADTVQSSRTSGPPLTHCKDPEDESCLICMETILAEKKMTLLCKHSFCRDCVKRAFEYKPVCPTCGELYGVLMGTQPEGGTMKVTKTSSPLPGYDQYGTIVIKYYIPNGIQMEQHPNPGQPYEGLSRTAYLPDSPEGRMVLDLLRQAFDQRLIFTVGRSTTSGRNNVVTWNDIHHKTSTHGGPTQYGYPDPDYLSRVRDELRVKGIK